MSGDSQKAVWDSACNVPLLQRPGSNSWTGRWTHSVKISDTCIPGEIAEVGTLYNVTRPCFWDCNVGNIPAWQGDWAKSTYKECCFLFPLLWDSARENNFKESFDGEKKMFSFARFMIVLQDTYSWFTIMTGPGYCPKGKEIPLYSCHLPAIFIIPS